MTEAAQNSDSAENRRPRSRGRRWPLRRQLLVSMSALLITAVVIIGSVSVGTQRQSLLHRLDDQLRIALDLSSENLVDAHDRGQLEGAGRTPADDPPEATNPEGEGQGPDPESSEPGAIGPGPQLGALSVVILNGETLVAQAVDEDTGSVQELSEDQVSELIEAAGTADHPAQVEVQEVGNYRLASREISGQGQDATVIAGQSLSEVSQTVRDQVIVFTLVALATLTAALLLGLALIRWGLRPLDRLAHVASKVTATPLSSGTVELSERVPEADADPGTEAGQVGQAFNTMLDHVEGSLQIRQDSEERLRRFAADASHELRTPLAAISGYTELASRRRDELPEDVGRSLGRISSESARMTVMVEDLLLLARLDAGSALRQKPVELAGVVVDACSDARIVGPDHSWSVELAEDAAEITVDADADRLHQVMTNLLTNARTHTPAGTEVTVRLNTAGDSYAVIEVEDNGPGISADLQERIFDRFVRGEQSRSRTAGSTGLGMSIVQAIVTAHQGRVELRSSPGCTRFTVTLPLRIT